MVKLNELNKLFSVHIGGFRHQKELTQEQFAELLKISPRCFQKWERGDSLPGFLSFLALVYFTDFDIRAFAKEVFSNADLQAAER